MTDTMGTNTEVYTDTERHTQLPPGVHPNDPSEPIAPGFGDNAAAPPDTVGNRYTTGAPPWKTDNADATPTFERASHDFSANVIIPNTQGTGTGWAVACGRTKGRKSVTLSVPTTLSTGATPLGVVWGATEDAVQQPAGTAMPVLNPGDSITINTEAQIFVGVIPGNATGAVQVVEEINPPGGALGTGA
jgi:hypothetical protein